jgi:predicted MPP superfamily phosphohydrolase
MAMDFKPDIIAMPGDFVHARNDGDTTHQDVPALGSVFAGFGAPDGVIGVLGNHDHWRNAEGVRRELSASPIRLIDNSRIVVTRGASSLALAGLGDLWEGELNFDSALGGLSGNVPVILLEHNPDLAETMPDGYRVDLQLSGHTHGGQVRIPFGPAPVLPSRYGNKYREGLVEGPRHRVYVTRGVGFSSPIPVRFFCRPEVTGITLRIG